MVRVEAKREDDRRVRVEGADRLERLVQRGEIGVAIGPGRQWQVQSRALARSASALDGVAAEVRIDAGRVAMEADVEDVRPLPEDLLRAVAVMEVDVEDGDALRAAREDRLGRDGRVVEEAVAADEGATGMVARRTAEGVRERLSRQHAVEGGQRDVDRGVGGSRGAGDDRRRGVEAERTQPIVAPDRQALERHARGIGSEEERVRQQWPRRVAAGGDRVGPGVLDEVDELDGVHRRDRVGPVIGRRLDRVVAGRQQRVADHRGALGRLEARDRLAGHELDQAVVREMIVGRDQRGRHRLRTIAPRDPRRRP